MARRAIFSGVIGLVLPFVAGDALARPPLEETASGQVLYQSIGKAEAKRNQIPFEIVDAVMRVESGYDPGALGSVGEVGLMQILPSTADMLGFKGTREALARPETNIAYGTQYLAEAWRLSGQDICTTVMKYRAGHGETRFSVRSVEYCKAVRSHLAAIGYPVTGDVPKPTFGFNEGGSGGVRIKGRVRVRFGGSGACFGRVVQPGRNFGGCITRAVLVEKGLLKK
ncbi:lytic transglycosylase domain-containing protein [Nordella sp. HKS 07]|uniref:lytic transglycosylase domain-containing protein n=1 Tax=Nordella sp. HKS 07 TaxID=2712222 RepID=UPI0013E16AB0|nr:transglycosylase SLT domain-containing protein [Nordella sp. HKS 07]QIG48619.1 lytic transglycosylase domain-containing protein [Nordella sp. HKS 07]